MDDFEMTDCPLCTGVDDSAKLELYRKLADGLSDMVESSRLDTDKIPDDYDWLVNLLAKIAGADPGPVTDYHAIGEDE
jgi:hypothetical protein